MDRDRIAVFALNSGHDFGERVSRALGISLGEHEERDFEDGEHKSRPLESVRGRDVFVVQSLYGDARESVNDKLCRLLFFLGSLKEAAAHRVTAVVPYLCYGRKDRQTKSRDPVTTRYVAGLFEAVGTDRVVTMDAHNLAAFQNAFRCGTDHLEATRLFVDWFAPIVGEQPVAVVSPDVGGTKRAGRFRDALSRKLNREVGSAFVEKYRSAGVVSGEAVVGEVAGCVAIIIDDLVSTGTTMLRAARSCRELGATQVYAAATHGLFVGDAGEVLGDEALGQMVVTDTIPPFRLQPALLEEKVTLVSAAPLCAEAIRRIHSGGSIVELIEA